MSSSMHLNLERHFKGNEQTRTEEIRAFVSVAREKPPVTRGVSSYDFGQLIYGMDIVTSEFAKKGYHKVHESHSSVKQYSGYILFTAVMSFVVAR